MRDQEDQHALQPVITLLCALCLTAFQGQFCGLPINYLPISPYRVLSPSGRKVPEQWSLNLNIIQHVIVYSHSGKLFCDNPLQTGYYPLHSVLFQTDQLRPSNALEFFSEGMTTV